MFTRRPALRIVAAVILCACAASAFAADPAPPPALSPDDNALAQKAVDYIQGLKGVQGKFIQTDPKGQVSKGAFYMQRPGKMRFQYDPPTQLLVADGVNVSVYDQKLKTFSQYPLEQTPLAPLLAKEVRLDRGVAVAKVEKSKAGFAITLRDARRPALGALVIQFGQSPMALQGWTVLDAQGQKTEVKLTDLMEKRHLPARLFILHDPTPANGRS